jgi:hypothetical protein
MLMHRIFLTDRLRIRHAALQGMISTLLEVLEAELGTDMRP